MSLIDLDGLPFVQARWYRGGRRSPISLLVVHTPEFPELNDGAERLAIYFATTTNQASVHCNVDSDSIVRCVLDTDTAFGAENANSNGLHAELVGYAGQTIAEWSDDYSLAVIDNAAKLFAAWCVKWDIPAVWLNSYEIQQGYRGITTHANVYQALGGQAYRWDPGPGFPLNLFMGLVRRYTNNEVLGVRSPDMFIALVQDGPGGITSEAALIENGMRTLPFNLEPRGAYAIPQEAISFRENSGGSVPMHKVPAILMRRYEQNYNHHFGI